MSDEAQQRKFFDKTNDGYGVTHIWFGPLGLHWCWPDFWSSRTAWSRRWRS